MTPIAFVQNLATIEIVHEVAPKKAAMLSAYRRVTAPRLILPSAYVRPSWEAFVPLVTCGTALFEEPASSEPKPILIFDFAPPQPARLEMTIRAFVARILSWLMHPLVEYSLQAPGSRERRSLEPRA